MANLANRIISLFLDQQTSQLRDVDICSALTEQGIPCDKERIRREVDHLSPGLFQSELDENGILIINVRPKVNDRESCSLLTSIFSRLRSVKSLHKVDVPRHRKLVNAFIYAVLSVSARNSTAIGHTIWWPDSIEQLF